MENNNNNRLARMVKFLRERTKIAKYFSDWFRLRPGVDRFFIVMIFFFMFVHVAACLWYLQAKLVDDPHNWIWTYGLDDESNFSVKLLSLENNCLEIHVCHVLCHNHSRYRWVW